MAPKVERIEEIGTLELAEGPHWDAETQRTNHVSIIIPVKGEKDKFLISIGRELATITWDGESEQASNITKIFEVDNDPDTIDNRFNDGKCDPSGRLWAGTMGGEPVNGDVKREKGSFFSFQNGKVTTHIKKIGISNGLAWNTELNKFYYIDTHKGTVEEYDYDISDGSIYSNDKTKMSKLEILPISKPLDVGTRIHWDEETQSLYYVDVPNSSVYKYDANTGETTQAKVGNEPLAFMFPAEGSNTKFIAGLGRKFVFVEWDGVSSEVSKVETIAEVETETSTMGPNDSEGNVILGKGSLYSLEKGILKKRECNIGCSNGLAWNIKEMKMYYIDTLIPAVFQYDFSYSGDISNKTRVFDFKENNINGLPDGLTIDSNGALWVTSVTFGGKNLDKMYVTTARIPVNGVVPEEPAGTTYVLYNVGSSGYPGDRYIP
ncbi:hypothetical protein NQ314_006059 [Rhamnusium bicolor]|uniref:SMP-30/Gluconolactonase/LRE-like region domain-containing protein n=1 Tax=Rhamnusium bicolor TaxID=1586634 RepID=A0AAV8ZAS7_9CUCU|nr:hypothetical protein NQ314_006059 [Rhamnusium bicolor]